MTLALALGAIGAPVAGAEPSGGSLTTDTYSGGAGSLKYQLFVPPNYNASTPAPLVVALHGCTQTADSFRQLTQFDDLAANKGFIVVYPEQSSASNQFSCWNWFQQQHQSRGAGEPSMIAGITWTIQQKYSIDPKRIFVAGFSAGGAMAEVMAATYPDMYAAAGVGSGCEYQAGAPCAGYQSEDPKTSGEAAYKAMGEHARAMPTVIFQGDQDHTVPPKNADQLIQSNLVTADMADGKADGSMPTRPAKTESHRASGGESYTVRYYADGKGHELMQYWTVNGMGHAWSGGNAAQMYSDPKGPDESAAMYDFFTNHPMGSPGPPLGCAGTAGGTGVPRVPRIPGMPTTASAPGTPSIPSVPGTPSIPSVPGMPTGGCIGMPNVPTNVPTSLPNAPGIPGVPSVPSIPGLPTTGQ
jgi:poly(hydroxyalkanoate) depolymerase family esterase